MDWKRSGQEGKVGAVLRMFWGIRFCHSLFMFNPTNQGEKKILEGDMDMNMGGTVWKPVDCWMENDEQSIGDSIGRVRE